MELRVTRAERGCRLAEEPDGGGVVVDRGPPAGLFVLDRRPGEELRVAQPPGELGDVAERPDRDLDVAGAPGGVTELEERLGALARLREPELERGAEPSGCLLEREGGDRGLGGEQVVRDGALPPPTPAADA